jgi:signal transduction histidine kinase
MLIKPLSNFAPVTIITTAAILAVSLAVLSAMLATNEPWLGVEFDRDYNDGGVQVLQVKKDSPANGKLKSGDVILAFVSPTNGKVEIPSFTTLDDPDQLESYEKYNNFFTHQQTVWDALVSPSFTAILSDNRQIDLTLTKYTGALALPMSFWWLIFFGGASFLLGISAWSLRRDDPVTRTLAVSGIGFMFGAFSCAIYSARELALPSKLFFALTSINHLGIMVFAYSAILFFWFYPKRLSTAPSHWILVIGVFALWLNETVQWLSWPMHVFYAHFVVAYSMLVVLAVVQWRLSKGDPLRRAMLKWLLATMLLCLGFTIAMYYVPIMLIGKPIASEVLTFGAVFLFYIGLVVGNIRYRQFDMELWWIRVWQWLLFVFIAMVADSLFLYFLHFTNTTSLGLSIGVGIVYLLARQWLWGKFSGNGNRTFDRVMPHLVNSLMLQQQNMSPEIRWKFLIERIFDPLSISNIPKDCDQISIEKNGVVLSLPDLSGAATIEAFCCDKGNRLFTSTDVYIANRLMELMRQSNDVINAREQGVHEERLRIQRDLHDDVAARLLTLMHQAHEPVLNKVAQNALRGLRDVIYLLGAEEAMLNDVMSHIQAAAREQVAGLGIHFEWRSQDQWPDILLNSQKHINLLRIAREAIANAIKHAHAENIIFEFSLENNLLRMKFSNNGLISPPDTWVANRGLNNIKSRVVEMAASHKWVIETSGGNSRYCTLVVTLPLGPYGQVEANTVD